MLTISIADDFSKTPGARYKSDGAYSGEEFREQLLYPKYVEAEESRDQLTINFDGCYGYATSFLEESFGGLVRKLKKKGLMKIITLISNDDVSIPRLVCSYVEKAEKEL